MFASDSIEQWGRYEVTLKGPTNGNPFLEVRFGAQFTHSDDSVDVLWWSKGGVLKGQSPARLAFLKQVLDDAPAEGIEPVDKWQHPEYGGRAPDYYRTKTAAGSSCRANLTSQSGSSG